MNKHGIQAGDTLYYSNLHHQHITPRQWRIVVDQVGDQFIFYRFSTDTRPCRDPWRKFNLTYKEFCNSVLRPNLDQIIVNPLPSQVLF
ncbi:hypothetical protein CLV58_10618 [Spirosoma oryzae]|uniref:Uncharacterized protein n=1 Tax=Spirosoma oryzae TaxID=1469603 RepID=A0A2T0T576_9BACT|nr:hypothetical protein [Spirosoma oryzae]PRY40835.1 hypothetical protein CLV58_10618 [Spirosoma oryzae]